MRDRATRPQVAEQRVNRVEIVGPGVEVVGLGKGLGIAGLGADVHRTHGGAFRNQAGARPASNVATGSAGSAVSRESSMSSPWTATLIPPRQGLHLALLTSMTCVQH